MDVVQGDGYTLYNADCMDVLPTLEAGSVDAIICDLPYGITSCRWDSVIPFAPMWAGIKHVIRPRAAIVLFGSQPFTSALVMSNVEWFKYCWVWDKQVSATFHLAQYQPMKYHEDICIFGADTIKYFPQMRRGKINHERGKQNKIYLSRFLDRELMSVQSDLGNLKYPRSIIEFNNHNSRENIHPTQKPLALLKYLIRTYTNEGDTVLDFTMGSGTTGVAAMLTGRKFIGVELDSTYFAIAAERITDAARTARREWKPLADTRRHDDLPLFQNGEV